MKTTKIRAKLNSQGKVVGYIDETTGKEYGFPVIFKRKQNPYGNGWIMNSQEALDIIAEDKEIKGFDLRVFLKVCARVDFENWVHLPIKEIGEELRIDKSQISRSIKTLVKKGILLKSEKIGRSYAYRLNPDFGWKGKVHHLEEYRKEQFNSKVNLKVVQNKFSSSNDVEILNFIKSKNIDIEELKEFFKK